MGLLSLASDPMETKKNGSFPTPTARAPRAVLAGPISSASHERVRALEGLSAMRGLLIGSLFGGLIWALIGLVVGLAVVPR